MKNETIFRIAILSMVVVFAFLLFLYIQQGTEFTNLVKNDPVQFCKDTIYANCNCFCGHAENKTEWIMPLFNISN